MASLGRFGGLGIVACTLGCGLVLDTGASGRDPDARADAGSARSDADLADGEAGTDAALPPPECDETSDCEPLHGPAPCSGAWVCTPAGYCGVECPGCTDGDSDGFGPENTCRGGDCDDGDFFVHDEAVETCPYTGPMDGACRPATRECTGGTWTECIGEILPTAEACNGVDDDCNGIIDDAPPLSCGVLGGTCPHEVDACAPDGSTAACPVLPAPGDIPDSTCDGVDDDCDGFTDEDCSGCVYVSLIGNDATGAPSNVSSPFRTIQAAIDYADTTTGAPKRVCLLAEPSGTSCVNARYDEHVTMRPGVSVRGSYHPVTGNPCPGGIYTEIESRSTAVSVEFSGMPADAITELADVRVFYGQAGDAVAAIRVTGATNVRLSNVAVIASGRIPSEAVGIDVTENGQAIITRSRIDVALASDLAVGVRAIGSRVVLRDNCNRERLVATGHCATDCTFGDPGIHTTAAAGAMSATGATAGVWLEDAAGSVLDATRVCSSADAGTLAALRLTGDASGVVVTRNTLSAEGAAAAAYGVHMDACRGTPPRIVANANVTASAATDAAAEGIYAGTGCDALIADNPMVVGAGEGRGLGTGVHCTGGSRCTVIGNGITGAGAGAVASARGIGLQCDEGSCLRVEDNGIEGGFAVDTVGVQLEGSRAVLNDNVVLGGCGSSSSIGMELVSSPARVTNSVIRTHFMCPPSGFAISPPTFIALSVSVSRAGAEPDVNSNLLDAVGLARLCNSTALLLEPGSAGPLPSGIYRNNVLVPGICETAHHVAEAGAEADPRVLEHDAFDPAAPFAYLDEGSVDILSLAEVEALRDMTAAGSLDVGCAYGGTELGPMLPRSGSPCVNAGMVRGAPEYDMYDKLRDDMPDIGPTELSP